MRGKEVKNINIETFEESLIDCDLVIYEKGKDPFEGLVLYGFDEIGLFDHEFKNPQYCIIKNEDQ